MYWFGDCGDMLRRRLKNIVALVDAPIAVENLSGNWKVHNRMENLSKDEKIICD